MRNVAMRNMRNNSLIVGGAIIVIVAIASLFVFGAKYELLVGLPLGLLVGYISLWIMETFVRLATEKKKPAISILGLLARLVLFVAIFLPALLYRGYYAAGGIAVGFIAAYFGLALGIKVLPRLKRLFGEDENIKDKFLDSELEPKYEKTESLINSHGNRKYAMIKSFSMDKYLHGRRYITNRRFIRYTKIKK
jgi:hypothetical protein